MKVTITLHEIEPGMAEKVIHFCRSSGDEEDLPELLKSQAPNDSQSDSPNDSPRDAEGLLWDVRIHSSSKGKVANGTWKLKRGLDEKYVEAVKAELGALPSHIVTEVIAAPVLVPPPPMLTPKEIGECMSFAQFMKHLTPLIVSGTVTAARIKEVTGALKLPGITALSEHPELIGIAWESFQ